MGGSAANLTGMLSELSGAFAPVLKATDPTRELSGMLLNGTKGLFAPKTSVDFKNPDSLQQEAARLFKLGDPKSAMQYYSAYTQLKKAAEQDRELKGGQSIAAMDGVLRGEKDPLRRKQILASMAAVQQQQGMAPEAMQGIVSREEERTKGEQVARSRATEANTFADQLESTNPPLAKALRRVGPDMTDTMRNTALEAIAAAGKSDKPPAEEKSLSTYGKQAEDMGYKRGTPEYRTFVQSRIDAANLKGVIDPMERKEGMIHMIETSPAFEASTHTITQAERALNALSGAEGTPQKISLAQRTVSEIYNGDTRAASEIDRFLESRGIRQKFKDYMNGLISGTGSQQTLDALEEIARHAQGVAQENRAIGITRDLAFQDATYGEYVQVARRYGLPTLPKAKWQAYKRKQGSYGE